MKPTVSPSETLRRIPGTIKPLDIQGPSATPAKPGWRKNWSADQRGAKERPAVNVPTPRGALSRAQIQTLIRHARSAYDIAKNAGLTDLSFDEWRHLEVAAACGCPGLTKAGNKHFRAILSHFLLLSGDASGLEVATRTGAAGGYQGETIEDRDQAIWLVRQALNKADLPENYALAIARRQFTVSTLEALNAAQAMALLYTLTRRARGDKK